MDGRSLLYLSAVSLLQLADTAPANSESATCRVEDCPNFRTIRYYEDLGCVRNDGSSDCCPTQFDCSSILSLDKTKCHYEGKTYEPGTEITSGIKHLCRPACSCTTMEQEPRKGEAMFLCAPGGCYGYNIPIEEESVCYRTYKVDQCCGTGVKCANDTKSPRNVTECPYKGKTFLEGQFIEGTDCMRCVCQEGYDGTLTEPWCRRQICDYTLDWPVSQLGSCAPVFRGDDNCCAFDFHCPSAADSVVRHNESASENKGDECSFGDHKLKIGDELRSTGRYGCVKCSCDLPPFITCKQRPDSECPNTNKPDRYKNAYNWLPKHTGINQPQTL